MKTKILILTFFVCSLVLADNNTSQSHREIIGSGIFDVNDSRKYTINDESKIFLDSMPIDYEVFEIIGSGFKSKIILSEANSSLESGTVNSVQLTTNLIGPVTSVEPLKILDQNVLKTADTVNDLLIENIVLNQIITVSGYHDRNNNFKASKLISAGENWKTQGYVSHITDSAFDIGSLTINFNEVKATNCKNGLFNGAQVEAHFLPDPDYSVGLPIKTLSSLSCILVNDLEDIEFNNTAVIQGYITDLHGNNFNMSDIYVNTSSQTSYINGEKNFIDTSVNVEIEGVFNSETAEIMADKIRFLDHRFEITFPVHPHEIMINHSITINGMTFYQTPHTKYSSILSDGINSSIQIQIQGYTDASGTAYISKVLNKGVVNFNKVSLRGNAKALNNPYFDLLNFKIDATNSQLINLGSGRIDLNTFFELIETNSQLEIVNAKYDEEKNLVVGGKITIREINNNQTTHEREIIGSGIIKGYVVATITATADQLFMGAFE